jgi:hypothetical protein
MPDHSQGLKHMPSYAKLNWRQRGFWQQIFSIISVLLCGAVFLYFLDLLEKRRFLKALHQLKLDEIIDENTFALIESAIYSMFSVDVMDVVGSGLVCFFLLYLLLKWSGKINWAAPVTLSQAVEFSSALRELGIINPSEQIEFIIKKKMPVYIAFEPLLGNQKENVRAKLYVFGNKEYLAAENFFASNIGRRTLCLAIEDYEAVVQEGKGASDLGESTLLTNKDKEINQLNDELMRIKDEMEKHIAEKEELKQKVGAAIAREGKGFKSVRDALPLWRVVIPMLARLKKDGKPGQYTKNMVQKAFFEEVESQKMSKTIIADILSNKDGKLPDWLLEIIQADLGDLASKGGRPSG